MRSATTIALVLGAAMAVPSAAQTYREGQPAVLQPKPVPTAVAGWDELRGILGQLGSPRFVVFWDTRLDKEIASSYQHVDRENSETRSSSRSDSSSGSSSSSDAHAYGNDSGYLVSGWTGVYGSSFGSASGGSSSSSSGYGSETSSSTTTSERTRRQGVERVGGPDAPPAETPAEKAYTNELRQGGLRFVDRTVAQRLAGIRSGERPNVKSVEMEGLTRYADFLIQVSRQGGGQPGYLVSVKSLRDGETVVDFSTSADSSVSGSYVATDRGFELAAPSPEAQAKTLANETAEKLRLALRQWPEAQRK